jgi:hypothetical protein
MKTAIRALALSNLVMLCSVTSMAGTPEQDFPVDMARERFRDATAPTLDFIKNNPEWRCLELNAVHNERPEYLLQDLPLKFSVGSQQAVTEEASESGFKDFSLTKAGLESRRDSVHFVLRRTRSGMLIGEVAQPKHHNRVLYVFGSLVRPQLEVAAFWYCRPHRNGY